MKKIKTGDIIIILSIIIISVLPLFFSEKGETAVIYVDGKIYAELDISKDNEISVNGTTVRTENGNAFFVSSECPDKLCIKSGKLHKSGDIASCVPNGVTLIIKGDTSEADGVTW